MGGMDTQFYQVTRLRDPARPGVAGLTAAIKPQENHWGLFTGLLGLPSNEAYLVTAETPADLPVELEVVESVQLLPTARPTAFEPPDQAGVYVFRWFSVVPGTVDEIVELSVEAWRSFEVDFAARIQGLFVESGESPQRMLLVTWYQDLSVWEASRTPSPDARENFLKRHQLTLGAHPIATQLHSSQLQNSQFKKGGLPLVSNQ